MRANLSLKVAMITSLLLLSGFTQAENDVIGQAPPTEPSIDCEWDGAFVTCDIFEHAGIGNVLIYRSLNGNPWNSFVTPSTKCSKTMTFSAHADGPSSLLIDVHPCGNSQKITSYRYLPMEPDSLTKKIEVLKFPDEKNLGRSIEALAEENKRLWKFLELQKQGRGFMQEN